ncbi:uncharacterized protein C15orf39 homolog isoform X1 [Empidonax traillii]|uniref:uncharacterized protein C15orf39 homolog isoform X1 n=1 Tax=Empidonax traillii TaxID=164674 RepID=UPI000FFCE98D|nr:uncharacterized protein C15orf39 homolog isoform X1 [Empidonax traillii]XP_027743808.1 uncharacterized protein C15orf39 homolog isoform X2 [Empidonax traillii]XP_027743816.1 uncharacterized protein C15orf39 homolog isoform X1 [Empidonax traillii]
MASKRCLESVDPVIFNKRPWLETEPATSFPSSKIQSKSSPVPSPGSENHFNYKGSYFACPLQSSKDPEQPLAGWSPAPTYLHYSPGAMSQPVPDRASLVGFLLYPSESLGARLQDLGAQKGKDSLMQEQLMARKKLDIPRCPLPVKKPVAVNKAAPLAVPTPVYGAPACFLAPRMVLPLGTRVESLQQAPREANWALPPAIHPLQLGEPHKRAPCPDPSIPPLPSSLVLPAKEQLGSPVALSHYYVTFDKYRPPPSTLVLEASCPSAHSQKKVPEVPSLIPDSCPKLQLPDAGLTNQERPAMCYPPPPYPLSPHRAAPLYHPPTPGEASALPSSNFVENRKPFSGSYLKPQAPGSYFPGPLDTHVPRTAGAGPSKPVVVLRDAELPRDVELPGYPGFTFNSGDESVFHTSLEPGCEQHEAEGSRWRAASRHSSAFQPVCTPEKLSRGSSGLTETFPKREGSWEKTRQGEQEPPSLGRRNTSPASQDTPCRAPVAPVIKGQGNDCKVKDPAKELAPPSASVTPTKGLEDLRDTKVFSSSPPMPVIHNVFSLAPYQDYLEKNNGSAPVLFCRDHLWGDPPPQNVSHSQEAASLRDTSGVSSPSSDSGVVQSQGESCYKGAPKNPKPVSPELESQEGSPDGVGTGELLSEDTVLDLSLRKRPVETMETQGLISCVERTLDQEDVEKEEKKATGGKVGEGAQPQLLEVGSGDRSNFQSSATFMFKKYKLLHSLTPGTEPPQQDGSPHAPQPSPPSSTPTPNPPTSSPSSSPPVPPPAPQPSTISGPNPPQPPLPEAPFTPGEEGISLARKFGSPPPETPPGQYFTTLHTWLCDTISGSVSRSSPELLQQWLKKAELAEELGEVPKSLPKPKNGSKVPAPQKPPKGKEIWLAFQDVATLLANLLSQLETFMFSCPFPHVVRAGAIFIPIHVVKEKLFPKLPGTSVDLVLQKHKVELRPTTLSEERHLRDLELKSCTSRMLKLLALKQLPEIYPDLLNLHWHNAIQQQLGLRSQASQHPSK